MHMFVGSDDVQNTGVARRTASILLKHCLMVSEGIASWNVYTYLYTQSRLSRPRLLDSVRPAALWLDLTQDGKQLPPSL